MIFNRSRNHNVIQNMELYGLNDISISNGNDVMPTEIDYAKPSSVFKFVRSILAFVLITFLMYVFVFPISKSTSNYLINTGQAQSISIANIPKGEYSIFLSSVLPPNKNSENSFQNFKVNVSLEFEFLDHIEKLNPIVNFEISPQFEPNEKISFPILLYSNELYRKSSKLLINLNAQQNSIDKIMIGFNYQNSKHVLLDLIWKYLGSILTIFIIVENFVREPIWKHNSRLLPEFEFFIIYIFVLLIGDYPFLYLSDYISIYNKIQKRIINSFYRCTTLYFISSLKFHGQPFSKIPYLLLFVIMAFVEIFLSKDNIMLPLIGALYLTLYLIEFFQALSKTDSEDSLKMKLYLSIITALEIFLFLSRMLSMIFVNVNLSHLNHIFPYIVQHIFAVTMQFWLR